MPRFDAKQIGRARGDDRDRRRRAGRRVDTTLHHPVAAPHEQELDAAVERGSHALRRPLRLRHLEPVRVVDPGRGELRSQLAEAAVECLARVRDDRNPACSHHSVLIDRVTVAAGISTSSENRCLLVYPCGRRAETGAGGRIAAAFGGQVRGVGARATGGLGAAPPAAAHRRSGHPPGSRAFGPTRFVRATAGTPPSFGATATEWLRRLVRDEPRSRTAPSRGWGSTARERHMGGSDANARAGGCSSGRRRHDARSDRPEGHRHHPGSGTRDAALRRRRRPRDACEQDLRDRHRPRHRRAHRRGGSRPESGDARRDLQSRARFRRARRPHRARAVDLMRRNAVRRLPVVLDDTPVGIVSLGDLAAHRDPDSALAAISEAPGNL